LLFRHKNKGISGIYPMNMPGHWRVMIVSHVLIQSSVATRSNLSGTSWNRTDSQLTRSTVCKTPIAGTMLALVPSAWNCGVWVAWVASMWTTHVERGLEGGTMDIAKVIKAGLAFWT
jgi:hypothetical protein